MPYRTADYFIFNNQNSSNYGISNCKIQSGLLDEQFIYPRSVKTVIVRGRDNPYFQYIEKQPLELKLQLYLNNGVDENNLRSIAQWLDQPYYCPLVFSDNLNKIYYAMLNNKPTIYHNGTNGYIEVEFICDGPYSYTSISNTQTYDFSASPFVVTDNWNIGTLQNTEVVSTQLQLSSYSSWNDTDGKDSTTGYDSTTEYDGTQDASVFFDNWIATHFNSYTTSGKRISNIVSLTPVWICTDTVVNWTANIPAGTSLTIEVSLDGGNTWSTVTNGGTIPGITQGQDLTNKNIMLRQTMTTSAPLTSTPQLSSLTITFNRGLFFVNSGDTICKPVLKLTKVGAGDISIINLNNNNQTFNITGLSDGEVLTIYNEEEIIQSSLNINRYNSFNDNYITLVVGSNLLKIIGNCKLSFTYQFKLLN